MRSGCSSGAIPGLLLLLVLGSRTGRGKEERRAGGMVPGIHPHCPLHGSPSIITSRPGYISTRALHPITWPPPPPPIIITA